MSQTAQPAHLLWRLAAVAFFGMASILDPLAATVAALLGISLLAVSLRPSPVAVPDHVARAFLVALGLTLVLIGALQGSFGSPEPAGVTGVLWIVGASALLVIVGVGRRSFARATQLITGGLIIGLAVSVLLQFGGNLFGLDVYLSHEAAADALAAGQNPYTDAVRFPDGSPNAAPGAVTEGYSYPPVTLLAFSLGDWLGGDPRVMAVVAIAFTALVLGVRYGPRGRWLVAAILVLLVATPTLRWVIWSGVTEPVALALVVGSVLTWRRWLVSALLFGLALAAKQYMVVLLPVLFIYDARPWRRSIVSAVTAAVTLIPAALSDFDAFWFTMVERPLSLAFRPDTQSLAGGLEQLGLRLEIPTWLMLVGVAATMLFIYRVRPTHPADTSMVLAASALVLAVAFTMSLAFTNYWWFVQWLTAVSIVLAPSGQEVDRTSTPVSLGDAAST